MYSSSKMIPLALVAALVRGPLLGSPQALTAQFGSTVTRVRVDVSVTDREGRFIPDLRRDEFELLEDGVAYPVLEVVHVDLLRDVVRRVSDATATEGAPDNPAPDLPSKESPEPPPRGQLGAIAYVIDGPGLNPAARRQFAEGWSGFLDREGSLALPRSVHAIDYLGRLRELVPLTTDAELLRAASQQMLDAPYFERATGNEGGEDELEFPDYIALSEGIHTFEVLGAVSRGLGQLPGRKALVWVSTGIDLREYSMGPSGGRAIDDFFLYDTRTSLAQQFMHRNSNTAGVSLYGLDPTRASQRRRFSMSRNRGPVDDVRRDPLGLREASEDATRDALIHAARATGGRAYEFVGASISDALTDIEADNSVYYILTYENPAPQGDGRYHRIEVRVRRPDVTVRARPGYIDEGPDEHARMALASAVALPGLADTIPFDVLLFRRLQPDRAWSIGVHVRIPSSDLVPLSDTLALHGQAVADQRIVDEIDRAILRETSETDVAFDWKLPPGDYDLRIALVDAGAGRSGANQLRLELPQPCVAWCVSDPIIYSLDPGARPVPAYGGEVAAGRSAGVLVQVAFGSRPVVAGELFDELGTRRMAELAPTELSEDPSGLRQGMLALPAMRSGRYLLRLRVMDALVGQNRVFERAISIVEH